MTDYALQGTLIEDTNQGGTTPCDLFDGPWAGVKKLTGFVAGDFIEVVVYGNYEKDSGSPTVTLKLERGSIALLEKSFAASVNGPFSVRYSIFCRQDGLAASLNVCAVLTYNGQAITWVESGVGVNSFAEDDFKLTSVSDNATTTVTCVGATLLYP